jgi:hypothetical protein
MKRLTLVVMLLATTTLLFAAPLSVANRDKAIGISISVAIGILLVALKKSKLGQILSFLSKSKTSDEELDKMVEDVLGSIGVPSALADFIGDVVAQVMLKLDIVHSDPNRKKNLVVDTVIDSFSKLKAEKAANLTTIDRKALLSSTARNTVIRKFVTKTEIVDQAISATVDNVKYKSRTDTQPSLGDGQGSIS